MFVTVSICMNYFKEIKIPNKPHATLLIPFFDVIYFIGAFHFGVAFLGIKQYKKNPRFFFLMQAGKNLCPCQFLREKIRRKLETSQAGIDL